MYRLATVAGLLALMTLPLAADQARAQHACIVGLGMENQQIWWTGTSKYLMDFTGGAPALSNSGIGQTGSFEGTAVYTSPTGTLLLYTDGDSIFNGQTHALIGSGVGGNPSSTEAALIVPVPAADPENDFYVFGNSANTSGVIRYTRVTIQPPSIGAISTLDGGRVFGESLGVVPHSNRTDFWMLSVTNAAPALNAYLVDAGGVSNTPVSSSIPLLPAGTTANRGTVVYHPPTGQLAFSFYSDATGTGYIYTATFDETTGTASAFTQVVAGDLGYAVAFSPDATKLYYSRGSQGFSGALEQFDRNTSMTHTIAAGSWAMPRLAPDQKIYVVGFGSTVMGVVNNPDQVFGSIDWNASGVSLPSGSTTSYALPDQTYAPCEVNVPSGSCAATPVTACNEAPKAHLKIKNTGVASKNRLLWRWFKGTVNAGDFDDPTASTSYAVCAYKDGALVAALDIEPGSNWAPISAGFKYKHRTAPNADGLFKAILKEGSGKARIRIAAKGVNLTVPAPPLDPTTNVVMQLVKDGGSGTQCWESTFTAPYTKDKASLFKAKTP